MKFGACCLPLLACAHPTLSDFSHKILHCAAAQQLSRSPRTRVGAKQAAARCPDARHCPRRLLSVLDIFSEGSKRKLRESGRTGSLLSTKHKNGIQSTLLWQGAPAPPTTQSGFPLRHITKSHQALIPDPPVSWRAAHAQASKRTPSLPGPPLAAGREQASTQHAQLAHMHNNQIRSVLPFEMETRAQEGISDPRPRKRGRGVCGS